jgi:hypothetical protein
MRFLSKLFNFNNVDCPRCLGKGDVSLEDIKRFKKELYWAPGKCAYCNGAGKVSVKKIGMIAVDTEYLTTDLSKGERKRLFNGDASTLQRAKEHKELIDEIIKKIEHLYYIENQEAEQIANYLSKRYKLSVDTSLKRQETIDYIKKVISSKLANK